MKGIHCQAYKLFSFCGATFSRKDDLKVQIEDMTLQFCNQDVSNAA